MAEDLETMAKGHHSKGDGSKGPPVGVEAGELSCLVISLTARGVSLDQ